MGLFGKNRAGASVEQGRRKAGRRNRAKARSQAPAKARLKTRDVRFVVSRVALVVLLLAMCVVPVIFAASPITYIPLVAVIVMICFSFAYLQVVKRGFEYSEASLLNSCERGVPASFEVVFRNGSRLPLMRMDFFLYTTNLFGEIDSESPSSLVLMPHEEHRYRFDAVFEHIGTYSAGVSRIVIGDLLGLFRHVIDNEKRHEVRVLPKQVELADLSLERVSVQDNSKAFQPVVTDDMDYAGVREYSPGDPLKTVHWKLSSRNPSGDYYTRLFEAFGNPSVNIVVDGTSPEYDAESLMSVFDCIMESALAIGKKARELGLDVTLTFADRAGEPHSMQFVKAEESSDLIAAIPRVEVGPGDAALRILRNDCQSIHGSGNVVFCTAHADEEAIECLMNAKVRKRNPLMVLAVPRSLEKRELADYARPLKRLQSARVPYHVVDDAAQIGGGAR